MSPRQQAQVARTLASTPRPLLELWFSGRRKKSEGTRLDPRLQLILRLREVAGMTPLYELSVDDARAQIALFSSVFNIRTDPSVQIEAHTIPGAAGGIPIRVYRPADDTARLLPVLLYFHGGGFVTGDLDAYDSTSAWLAQAVPCAVVSVEYRLAPEHRFPAAVEDAASAFEWVVEHGQTLGLDATRIALGGDSAGGNLAAVTAHHARDRGGPRPALQVLIYPGTDLARGSESHQTLSRGYFLDRPTIDWFREHYFEHPQQKLDPRASPLRAKDFTGLAPAVVITAGFDPLRDEGRAYARALVAAGVQTENWHYPDVVHGFWSMGGVLEQAREAHGRVGRALRRAFEIRD